MWMLLKMCLNPFWGTPLPPFPSQPSLSRRNTAQSRRAFLDFAKETFLFRIHTAGVDSILKLKTPLWNEISLASQDARPRLLKKVTCFAVQIFTILCNHGFEHVKSCCFSTKPFFGHRCHYFKFHRCFNWCGKSKFPRLWRLPEKHLLPPKPNTTESLLLSSKM